MSITRSSHIPIIFKGGYNSAVATIMALDRAIRCGGDSGDSVYDGRGLLIL